MRHCNSKRVGPARGEMCQLYQTPSNIEQEWLDGIFAHESFNQQTTGTCQYFDRTRRKIRQFWKINRNKKHDILVIDPDDTEVLDTKREFIPRKIKLQLEDLVKFYLKECVYTPILYMMLVILLSDHLPDLLSFPVSLILSIVVVLFHYFHSLIYQAEEDEDDD